MNNQFPYKVTPVEIPFVMRANALRGYHYKYWIAFTVFSYISTVVVFYLFVPSYVWFIAFLLPLAYLPLILTTIYNIKNRSVTLYQDSIEVKNGKDHSTIPFAQLMKVKRGYIGAGASSYGALRIQSTDLQKTYTPSALHYQIQDLRNFYSAIPAEYRDDSFDFKSYLDAPASTSPVVSQ